MGDLFTVFWQGIFMAVAAMAIMKLAGRKSLSEMTIFHFVIMLGIGDLIIEPITRESLSGAVVGVATFVFLIILMDFLEIRFNWFERKVVGYAKILVKDGKILEDNLKKERMTVDLLEMKLRQQGITSIEHCETVTLEANGQLGYNLFDKDEPVKYEDFEALINQKFEEYFGKSGEQIKTPLPKNNDLFVEVREGTNGTEHEKKLE